MPDELIVLSGPTKTLTAPGAIVIREADNPHDPVEVQCHQIAAPIVHPPQPRWQVVNLSGRTGVNEYLGQDPYAVTLTIRFGGDFPARSIEQDVEALQAFAEVHGDRTEPPVLETVGAIPKPQPNIKWQLTAIEDPFEQDYMSDGKRRSRYATRITLTQASEASKLNESLKATKRAKGLKTRTTKVRPGESDLYAVARRYYGDPSRASDISRANPGKSGPLPLGTKLKAGTTLRMPS